LEDGGGGLQLPEGDGEHTERGAPAIVEAFVHA
jgi:hypothetical protein